MVSSVVQIKEVPVMRWGMVNAFIVYTDQKCILVDAGLPDSALRFETALKEIGRTWSDVSLIVVTHAHIDHAGAAALIREKSDAPIVAHEAECDFLAGRKEMTFCPTRPFGRLFLKTGAIQTPYTRFVPDIILRGTETLDLAPYGLQGQVVPTPGHTPGSISMTLPEGTALVGDMVASGILLGGIMLKKRPQRPPFEDDPGRVAEELRSLLGAGAKRFYLGHGGPLSDREVRRHVESLEQLKNS